MISLELIIYSLSEPTSKEVGWLHKINDVLVLSFYDNGEWKCISNDITEELINAETTNRTLADTALDIRIDAEANTRNSADIALSSALTVESSYRANADALLNSDVVAEKTRATTVENTIGTSVGLNPETKIYTNTGLYIGKLIVNTVTSDIKALDTLTKSNTDNITTLLTDVIEAKTEVKGQTEEIDVVSSTGTDGHTIYTILLDPNFLATINGIPAQTNDIIDEQLNTGGTIDTAIMNKASLFSNGILGSLTVFSVDPTPGKNGYYVYTDSGTNAHGTIDAGDTLLVTYDSSVYTYTLIKKKYKLTYLSDVKEETYTDGDVPVFNGTNQRFEKENATAIRQIQSVSNEEFIYVVIDSDNHILWGIKNNGTIYYGMNVPTQIQDEINNQISDLREEIKIDANSINEINETIIQHLNDIETRIPQSFDITDYITVVTDSDNKIIEGITRDGTKIIYINTILKSVHIEEGIADFLNILKSDINQNNVKKINIVSDKYPSESDDEFTHSLIENEEYIQITLDKSSNKIIEGITKDGERFISILKSPIIDELQEKINSQVNTPYVLEVSPLITNYDSTNAGNVVDYLKKEPTEKGIYIGYNITFSKSVVLGIFKIGLYKASLSDVGTNYDFVIGTVDQRGWILPRITLTKSVTSLENGLLCFDFTSDKIVAKSTEVIFIYAHQTVLGYEENSDNIVSIWNNTSRKNMMFANIITSSIAIVTSSFCSYPDGIVSLTTHSFDSIFPTNMEFNTVENNVNSLSLAVSKKQNSILEDRISGEKYRLIMLNGALTTKSLNYSKILLLGNSYTSHPYGSVWPSEGRSMAASVNSCMYGYHLHSVIGSDIYRAGVSSNNDPLNTSFERGLPQSVDNVILPTSAKDLTNADVVISSMQFDCIIVQFGENIVSTDTNVVYNAFTALYKKLKTLYPSADIFGMFGKMYGNKLDAICNSIEKAASDQSVPLVDCSYVSLANHYQYKDYVSADDGTLVEVDDAVYGSHPSDAGMYAIAQKLLSLMEFEDTINRKFNIIKNQTSGGVISSPCDFWISEGVVTIRCVANSGYKINSLSVITDGNITVQTTKRTGTYDSYTFIMPSDNVTVTPNWILI